MHLTNKQLFTLIFPFLIGMIFYLFDMDIVKNVKYLFPNYEEYTNKTLDKKAVTYLKIEAKGKLYQEIQDAMIARNKNARWISEHVLYKKMNLKIKSNIKRTNSTLSRKITKKRLNAKNLQLQAVFSKDKVAIINGHFVKESASIGGVKILKIEQERVLLDFKKGKKWIYLFR